MVTDNYVHDSASRAYARITEFYVKHLSLGDDASLRRRSHPQWVCLRRLEASSPSRPPVLRGKTHETLGKLTQSTRESEKSNREKGGK